MVLFYHLFALLDMIVYSIASSLFKIIIDLGSTPFFRAEQIETVANRIYIVVGVVMLFKIVLAAIQYMINPDTFDDKEKGLFGLLKNTALSLAMMVIAPAIFNFLIEIQTPIIQTLPSVILGSEAQETNLDDRGFAISFRVLSSFIKIRPGHEGDVSNAGVGDNKQIHDFQSFYDHVTEHCPWSAIFGSMDSCTYDYLIIVSTAAGGFLVYMLMSMALDVAIRAIKFSIIRMLAPIPIASYIFNKEKFNKFVKTTSTVYFDLFIRMAIIYFIMFAISEMLRTDVLNFLGINGGGIADTGDRFRNIIVNILIIFGLLMFAKNAPKFITDLLGLPEVGSGDMADMFKPAWTRAGGAAAALINPLRSAGANVITSWQQSRNLRGKQSWWKTTRRVLRATGAGIAGLGEGAIDSAQGVAAGDDWTKMRQRMRDHDTRRFRNAYQARYYRENYERRWKRDKDGSGDIGAWNQMLRNRGAQFMSFLGQTPVNSQGYSDASSAISSLRSEAFTGRAKSEVDKDPTMFKKFTSATSSLTGGSLVLCRERDEKTGELKAGTGRGIHTTFDFEDAGGTKYTGVDYGKLHLVYKKMQSGTPLDATDEAFLTSIGIDPKKDLDKVEDVHERAGKKAYAEYVDVVHAAKQRLDEDAKLPDGHPDKLTTDERDRLTAMADREVLDRIERFREKIVALNIPDKEKAAMLKSLDEDPGKWLAGANKKAQEFSTMATKLGKMEAAAAGKKDS